MTTIFKALSDEVRLQILCLLAQGPLCVCEIEHILKIPQSSVSRNLSKLNSARLTFSRRDGQFVYYSINDAIAEQYPFVKSVFHTLVNAAEYQSLIDALERFKGSDDSSNSTLSALHTSSQNIDDLI